MERVDIKSKKAAEEACIALDEGGIVMHPTETCYGFAADIFNEDALKKLYIVKNMKVTKPLSILVDGLEMAQEYGVFSKKALELAKKYWPGPLSIVVPRSDLLPKHFNPGHEFVSMRVSGLDFCRDLVSAFTQPVTTTSANRSREPENYEPVVMGGVDLLVDGGRIPLNHPSTIVRVMGDKCEILRQGDLVLDL